MTEGEDLRLLFQEELESGEEEDPSSDGVDSSSEEEIDSSSGDDEPMGGKPFQFLGKMGLVNIRQSNPLNRGS